MLQCGVVSANAYRYGFNGKENDNEVKGVGNSLDFGARIYDSRLGVFLSVDPLTKNYPYQSPYVYGDNNPVVLIDMEGEHGVIYVQIMSDKDGKPAISKKDAKKLKQDIEKRLRRMNVAVRVTIVYSNDIMSKQKFKEREGFDIADSYVIVGSAINVEEASDNAAAGGWERPSNLPGNVRGVSTDHADGINIAYVNTTLVNENSTRDNDLWKSYSLLEKITLVVQHEDAHPKFKYHSKNFHNGHPSNIGHVTATIMSEMNQVNLYDNEMKQMLIKKHGVIFKYNKESKKVENVEFKKTK